MIDQEELTRRVMLLIKRLNGNSDRFEVDTASVVVVTEQTQPLN